MFGFRRRTRDDIAFLLKQYIALDDRINLRTREWITEEAHNNDIEHLSGRIDACQDQLRMAGNRRVEMERMNERLKKLEETNENQEVPKEASPQAH